MFSIKILCLKFTKFLASLPVLFGLLLLFLFNFEVVDLVSAALIYFGFLCMYVIYRVYSNPSKNFKGLCHAMLIESYKLTSALHYIVVFVLGGPGSGKGTNCARIVKNFGFVHLSAGDLLRAEREKGTELADMINTYIREGKIVPAEVTVRLLKEAMISSGNGKFLVDGFPRDMMNFDCWRKDMNSIAEVLFLLFLDCPQEVMLARLLERGKTSGRNDDNETSIKKRFITYEESTRPIIDYFQREGKIRQVDSNRDIEDVYADVAEFFRDI